MTATFSDSDWQSDGRFRPLSVLVVDDEPNVCHAVARLIRALGCLALQATDASRALTLVGSGGDPVDLVLSDVCMPGMNGLELRQALRSRYPKMPVLLMSANAASELMARGIDANRLPLLRKPFGLEELSRLLSDTIDGNRA